MQEQVAKDIFGGSDDELSAGGEGIESDAELELPKFKKRAPKEGEEYTNKPSAAKVKRRHRQRERQASSEPKANRELSPESGT